MHSRSGRGSDQTGENSWNKLGLGSPEFMPTTMISGMKPQCAATLAVFIVHVVHSLASRTATAEVDCSSSAAAADPLFPPLPFGFGFSDGRDAMATLVDFSDPPEENPRVEETCGDVFGL